MTGICGIDDPEAVCDELAGTGVNIVQLPGGHHFDGDYQHIARLILASLPESGRRPATVYSSRRDSR